MPEVTRNDVIHEAIEKVQPTKAKANEQRKKLLEHTGAIISISIVVLTLALYAYNKGYCSVYNLPPECMPLNVTSYLPLAARLCSTMIYLLWYISSLKTSKLLNKNRFSFIRILYGEFIIYTRKQEEMRELCNKYNVLDKVKIDSFTVEQKSQILSEADFGFVLRDDDPVNKVACPTKLME